MLICYVIWEIEGGGDATKAMNSEGRIRLEFGKQLQADHGRGANRQIGLEFFMRRNERAAVSISHQNGDEKQTAPPAQTQTPRGPNAALEAISVATSED